MSRLLYYSICVFCFTLPTLLIASNVTQIRNGYFLARHAPNGMVVCAQDPIGFWMTAVLYFIPSAFLIALALFILIKGRPSKNV